VLIGIKKNKINKKINYEIDKSKKLKKWLTSNSAERWNRKIEKVVQGRYGLKSEQFVLQLITSLWLKESIIDKRHFEKYFIHDINFKKISQENIKMSNIINILKHKLLKKVA